MSVADPLVQSTLLGEAVENGPAAVFVADEARRYVAVNKAACDLLGYDREELLALDMSKVAADLSRWDEMVAEGTITGTAKLRRKDGTTISFSYAAGHTKIAGMPVYVSIGVAA